MRGERESTSSFQDLRNRGDLIPVVKTTGYTTSPFQGDKGISTFSVRDDGNPGTGNLGTVNLLFVRKCNYEYI